MGAGRYPHTGLRTPPAPGPPKSVWSHLQKSTLVGCLKLKISLCIKRLRIITNTGKPVRIHDQLLHLGKLPKPPNPGQACVSCQCQLSVHPPLTTATCHLSPRSVSQTVILWGTTASGGAYGLEFEHAPQGNTSTDTLENPLSKSFPELDACSSSKCKKQRPRKEGELRPLFYRESLLHPAKPGTPALRTAPTCAGHARPGASRGTRRCSCCRRREQAQTEAFYADLP